MGKQLQACKVRMNLMVVKASGQIFAMDHIPSTAICGDNMTPVCTPNNVNFVQISN